MQNREIDDVLARYGRGDITVDQAAVALRPVHRASAEQAAADRGVDDAWLDPGQWIRVDLARQTRVITVAQYGALCDAVTALGLGQSR